MSDWKLSTPVALIIFNRPDTTKLVFAEIAKVKPPKLLVVADGARPNRRGEVERCAAARAIIKGVNWDCEVLTNYSNVNLGCRTRVSSGLDWVFEQVPEAIILEDDCLPNPTFFRFCEEMLVRYREDARVGMVSGDNFQFGRKRSDASYYYSRYTHIWGWGSWRRVWKFYDCKAAQWPKFRDEKYLNFLVPTSSERRYWANVFQQVYDERIDTWDYQLNLTLWSQGMVCITPAVNLISNIGFGKEATHTRGLSVYANMQTESIDFPLRHPEILLPNGSADAYTAKGMFKVSFIRKIIRHFISLCRKS